MIIGRKLEYLFSVSNVVRSHVIKHFASNKLIIKLDKINIMEFLAPNPSHSTARIGYEEEYEQETLIQNFVALRIDININWKEPCLANDS